MNKQMKLAAVAAICAAVSAQAVAATHTNNALPVPKNVPELMKTFAGADVKTRADWEKVRAPELLACFEREEYGKRPAAADERGRVSFETYRETEVFGGKAVCRHVRVKYDGPNGKHVFPITATWTSPTSTAGGALNAKSDHAVERSVMSRLRRLLPHQA